VLIEPTLQVEWPAFRQGQVTARQLKAMQDTAHRLVGTGSKIPLGLNQIQSDDIVDRLALLARGGPDYTTHEAAP
jgi:hypothetical protein